MKTEVWVAAAVERDKLRGLQIYILAFVPLKSSANGHSALVHNNFLYWSIGTNSTGGIKQLKQCRNLMQLGNYNF